MYWYVSIYSEKCFWPQYMYPRLSPNNGYRWCPLGKLSHLGMEQLYLGNKLPHPTNRNGIYGQTQTHEGGICPSPPQGTPKAIYHSHALHYKCVVVAPFDWIDKLCHPDKGDWTDAGNDHQPHNTWIHVLKTQDQESSWHCLYIHINMSDSHIDLLRDSPGSVPPREIPIPKLYHPLHGIHRNE